MFDKVISLLVFLMLVTCATSMVYVVMFLEALRKGWLV